MHSFVEKPVTLVTLNSKQLKSTIGICQQNVYIETCKYLCHKLSTCPQYIIIIIFYFFK